MAVTRASPSQRPELDPMADGEDSRHRCADFPRNEGAGCLQVKRNRWRNKILPLLIHPNPGLERFPGARKHLTGGLLPVEESVVATLVRSSSTNVLSRHFRDSSLKSSIRQWMKAFAEYNLSQMVSGRSARPLKSSKITRVRRAASLSWHYTKGPLKFQEIYPSLPSHWKSFPQVGEEQTYLLP